MDILEVIKSRRSIREFKEEEIEEEIIRNILIAGSFAPSGLNNQPWRFLVVRNREKIKEISNFTKYKRTIEEARLLIIVYLDRKSSYHHLKDVQAIGACIQNMLIYIHDKGLGACWIGEILNKEKELNRYLEVGEDLELMAVLAIGYPRKEIKNFSRKRIDDLIIRWD